MKKLLFAFLALASIAEAQTRVVIEASDAQATAGTLGLPYVITPRRMAASGGGNVSKTGTPTNGQFAQWTDASHVQGVTFGTGVATALGNATNGASGLVALDGSGNISLAGSVSVGVGGSAAGYTAFGQGTAPSTGTTNVTLAAPASVTSWLGILPGTVGTNGAFWTQTTSGTTATLVNTKVVPTGVVLGDTDTQTLTNKRVTARITTITSSATPTINTDNCDCVTITALAAAITSMTTNLTGTPVNFDQLEFRIKDDGTARAITWGATFVAGPTALPTTTVVNKALHVFFEWDSVQSKWVCLSSGSDA